MKFILALLMLISSGFAATPEVKWMDFQTAVERAKKDSLFVLVEVYADWCMPCKEMNATTFKDSAVVQMLNTRFFPVRLNAESTALIPCDNWPRTVSNCVMQNWRLQGVPSFVLIGPSGNLITSITDALDALQMQQVLQEFIDGRSILLETDRKLSKAKEQAK